MPEPKMATMLPDVHTMNLEELGEYVQLEVAATRQLIEQVERPRPNIGTGPPGRAD